VVKENILQEKSFQFALKIIGLYKFLQGNKEFVISKQLLRSGTSIGANIEEAIGSYSKREFASKMSISLKEARETKYFIRLLDGSKMVEHNYESYLKDVEELVNILTAIVKTCQAATV
jgi:four helix bundle protein